MSTTSKVTERITELKSGIAAKIADQDTIVDSVNTDDNGSLVLTPEKKEAFSSSVAEAKSMRDELEMLEQSAGLADWAGATPGSKAIEVDAVRAIMEAGGFTGRDAANEAKTVGARFVDSTEFKTLGGGKNGVIMPAPFELKDIYSNGNTGFPTRFGTVERVAPVSIPMRKVRMRDIINVVKTEAAVIEFFRQTAFNNNASVVPERNVGNTAFGQKPESTMTWQGVQAFTRTIAHYEVIHRNTLADEPVLAGFIDNQLLYGLRLAEDYQILNGTGTGEDLLGIMNTPGVQTNAGAGGTDQQADTIRKSITKILLLNMEPSGIVLNPIDWQNIELLKDSQNRYIIQSSPAENAPSRLWSLPIVDTPAMNAGTALVGAFQYGTTLYDREQANIRTADQHLGLFTQNAVAILAEERLALATMYPPAFVKTTF